MDKNLYDLEPEEAAKVPHPCASLDEALDHLDKDRAFLTRGGVFTNDMLDALHRAQDGRGHALPDDHAPGRVRHVLQPVNGCALARVAGVGQGRAARVRPFCFTGAFTTLGAYADPVHPYLQAPVRCARRRWCAHAPARRCAGFAAALAAVAAPAQADICKYADPEGNIHYSNVPPEKGWKRISCTVGDDGAPQPRRRREQRRRAADAHPGRVSARRRRDAEGRATTCARRCWPTSSPTEQKLLAEARTAYADGAPPPLPEERADAEKYRARIGKLRQTVTVHEKNIEALKKEIALVK